MTYTNTSLATHRRCGKEYEFRYPLQLEPDGLDSIPLQVGQVWHRAFFDSKVAGDDAAAYACIHERSPGPAWREKLRRLFAAYRWYWGQAPEDEFEVEQAEHTFRVELDGIEYEGQIDGILRMSDGRRGIMERKTTSESVAPDSVFWNRLRLNVQVGIYEAAAGFVPDFIVYDVVRKPTINPKALSKAEVVRMQRELDQDGECVYYEEKFAAELVLSALSEKRESLELYGARLTSDIGNEPSKYFARRIVTRRDQDRAALRADLAGQVRTIRAQEAEGFYPRNPDQCQAFGTCAFYRLCSNNAHDVAPGEVPEGFRRREHLHPELV